VVYTGDNPAKHCPQSNPVAKTHDSSRNRHLNEPTPSLQEEHATVTSTNTPAILAALPAPPLLTHPDVFKCIMSFCHYSTLSSCLRLSKGTFDIVGSLLYYRISLDSEPITRSSSPSDSMHHDYFSPFEDHGNDVWGFERRSIHPFGGLDPSYMSKSTKSRRSKRVTFKNRLLDHCRILRVEDGSLSLEMMALRPFLPNLPTLCMSVKYLSKGDPNTDMHDFTVWRPERLVLRYGWNEGMWRPVRLWPSWRGKLKELVLLMDGSPTLYDEDLPELVDHNSMRLMDSISTVTVIFDRGGSWGGWTVFELLDGTRDRDGAVKEAIAHLANWIRINKCVLRLVNVGSLRPERTSPSSTPTRELVAQAMEARIRGAIDTLPGLAGKEEIEKVQARLHFMTIKEYAKNENLEGVFP
jgi:hypothetical protein